MSGVVQRALSQIDVLPLRAIEVPPEVYRMQGCDCGGGPEWHRCDCSVFSLSPEQIDAAAADARARIEEFDAGLTVKLRAAGL